MCARSPRPRFLRRVAAHAVTGPVAFLLAGLVDWVVLLSRYLYARARGRRTDWYLE